MTAGRHVTVVIATPLEEEHIARIWAVDPRLRVLYRADLLGTPRYIADHHPPAPRSAAQEAEFARLLGEAEVLFDIDTGTADRLVSLAPNLRWLQTSSAGVGPLIQRIGLDKTPTLVTTASGIHAGPLAEFVLLAALMFTKRAFYLMAAKERREWDRFCSGELAGRTMAIVGPGKIGREVAQRARAFGMRVTALGRAKRTPGELGVDVVFTRGELPTMLGEADFLVLAVPHTPETENMIGPAELAALPPHAILINIARGQVLDEEALVRALREGHLAGAALDVFRDEPLPATSPFWALPNVLLNPHSASTADSENRKLTEIFCENLRHYLDGRPERMHNVLDKHRLY